MRIALVVTGLRRIGERSATSDHASTRLRALIPATGLIRRGHKILIFSDMDMVDGLVDRHLADIDVLVLHKCRLDLGAAIRRVRAAGIAVVIDVCDHVFIHPVLATYYPRMLASAQVITAATETLGGIVAGHLDRPVHVIADAVEGPRGEPDPSERLDIPRLMWFGRSQNAGPLVDLLPDLARIGPARLEIVTNDRQGLPERIAAATPPSLGVTTTPWSVDSVTQALGRSDLVLVPRDSGDGHRIKSANRLERALWGGCMVVAAPTPSAEFWADVVYVDRDLAAAADRALADRATWPARITRAQKRLVDTRSGSALALLWEQAASEACALPGPDSELEGE